MIKKATIHPADQGPWGKPKGGGGNGGGGWTPGGGRTPKGPGGGDLDDFMQDIKRHFDNLFSGPGNHRGLIAGFFILLLLWLVSGMYQLQPGELGVVLRFGKFDRIASPGLRYHLPTPFEGVTIVNAENIRNETLGGDPASPPHGGSSGTGEDEILMLTGDENIINMSFNVRWKVRDAKDYVFNITDPENTVRAVTESAVREVIGQTALDAALTTGKSKVEADATKLTQETLDNYKAGIQVLDVSLLDASFPREVVDAARDVQAARADQEAQRNTAEGYSNDILPRARGKAEVTVQEAEAYKQQVVAQAQGAAARFNSVYAQYKQAEDVTRKRIYLETMERILENTTKVILDTKSGVVPYLPLPEIKSGSGLPAPEKGGQP